MKIFKIEKGGAKLKQQNNPDQFFFFINVLINRGNHSNTNQTVPYTSETISTISCSGPHAVKELGIGRWVDGGYVSQ